MKTKLLFFVFLFGTQLLMSQSNQIIIPSSLYNQVGTLPLPQPINGPNGTANDPSDPMDAFDGQPFNYAANIISKPSGEIEFFIHDGHIYNADGFFITRLLQPGFQGQGGAQIATGSSEVMVIPFPGQCNKYYIFSSIVQSNLFWIYPSVFILDMNTPSSNISLNDPCSVMGNLVDLSGNIIENSAFQEVGNGFEIDDFLNHSGFPFYIGDPSPGKSSSVFFASTEERADGSRLAFVSNGKGFFTFLIAGNGITFQGFTPFPSPLFNQFSLRSEMEVVALSNNQYRIAVPFMTNVIIGPNQVDTYLYTATLDFSGMPVVNSENLIPFFYNQSSNGDETRLRGVEFSDDGRYLYVSHTTNSLHPNAFEYFDFTNPSNGLTAITNVTGADFQHSGLESGMNNSLLIATQSGLYSMDAGNPSSPINLLANLNYQANFQGQDPLTSTAKFFMLQDQIDNMNYDNLFLSDLECCVRSKTNYDIVYFETSQSATWSPGVSTPFSGSLPATIYIREELRVKAGTILSLNNLTLKFAPGARLVIENGNNSAQGGRLILNNTTLTVDDSCDPGNVLWLGVEVWGNQNLEQGNYFSSVQGRLQMQNNSIIEHAYIGTLVGRRTSTIFNNCPGYFDQEVDLFQFDDNYNGGIIRVFNSDYLQNQRGIWMRKYLPSSGVNNLSIVTNGHFEWNNPLNGGISVQSHIMLESIKGLVVKGSDFWNMPTAPYTYIGQGMGIYSRGSQFVVDQNCPTLTTSPCTNPDKTHFKNLDFGIHASNPTDNLTFSVQNSEFENCVAGIYSFATRYERINKNTFASHEDQFTTVGVYLRNSTGYTVQENNFTGIPIGLSPTIIRSHGMIVENSGTLNNLVYKNNFGGIVLPNPAGGTFTGRLWAGSLSLKTNGTSVPAAVNSIGGVYSLTSGLKWKCNNFIKQIEHADVMVNGIIDYNQGTLVGFPPASANTAAANTFSASGSGTPQEHDIMVDGISQPIRYIHLSNSTHIPNEYTVGKVFPFQNFFFGQPLATNSKTCPSKLNKPIVVVVSGAQDAFVLLNEQIQKIKNGNDLSLLNTINSTSNYQIKRDALLAVSPFLADTILIAWINSGAPSGMIKDVLLANTKLSSNVLNVVNNSNLPIGTKSQIINAQSGLDLKEETFNLIAELQNSYDENFNDALSRMLLDTVSNMGYEQVISFLSTVKDNRSKKVLVDIQLAKNDLLQMDVIRDQLPTEELEEDYDPLQSIKEIMQPLESETYGIDSIPYIASDLDYLAENAGHPHIRSKSKAFLEFRDGPTPMPELPPFGSTSMMIQPAAEVGGGFTAPELTVSVYPNPSTGKIWIDYPKQQEGILTIQLLDLNGKLISTYTSSAITNGEHLDFSEVKKGFYLLDIMMDGTRMETIKLHLH